MNGLLRIPDLVPGLRLGPSGWIELPQARIDAFADATEDKQWIHIDTERAQSGPFESTIAHGYLTLALLAPFSYELLPVEASLILNYGLNRVRFPTPVPSGSRLRAVFEIAEINEIDGGVQAKVATTIELEGHAKPACVAELVFRYYT